MAEEYSWKRAAKWAGAGLGVSALCGTFYAVSHHARNHFETLQEAFMHVAQPEFVVGAIAVSAAFGAYMEFKRWYHANLDQEEAERARPDRTRNKDRGRNSAENQAAPRPAPAETPQRPI